MHAETTVWETPILAKSFDLKAHGQQLEDDVVAPAIKAIVAEVVNQKLVELNPFDRSKMRIGTPKEGWDSAMRFDDGMERVMPYIRQSPSPFGVGWQANPAFENWGLIVFSRNSPEGSHSFKVSRKTVHEKMGQKVMAWVTVTIPDESVFETEWFRLQ